MKKTMLRAVWLALAVLLLGSVVAQAKAMVLKENANLYKKASVKAEVLLELEKGQKVEVGRVKSGWAKVKCDGKTGFMKKAVLGAKPEDSGDTEKVRYAQKTLKLLKACSPSAKSLGAIPAGAEVTVLAEKGAWAKVRYGGKTGFVKKAALGAEPVSQPDQPEDEVIQQPEDDGVLQPGDSGEAVKKLQTRLKNLEWFYGDIGGNYKTQTTQAVKDFQEACGISVTGIADKATQKALYASDAPRNVLNNTGKPASGKAVSADWWTSGIQDAFARGKTVTVTDVETGITFQVYRSGGTNHADVQPKTAQDTALMKKAYGGNWSWNRRAIWVSIGGVKYAASMNGMPHGSGSITDNNFDGHFCIHFTNSRTHGSNQICALHQAAIQRALAA